MKPIIALSVLFALALAARAAPFTDGDSAMSEGEWSVDTSAAAMDESGVQADTGPAPGDTAGRVEDERFESADIVPAGTAAGASAEKAVVDQVETKASAEDEPRVKKALNFGTAGFGPGVSAGLETDKLTYNFYGGKLWEIRAKAIVRANGELITDFRKVIYLAGNIGFGYFLPFTIFELSPYAAGEIGMGLARKGKDNGSAGFNLGAIFGVILFQTSDIQLSLETKAQTLLADFKGGSPAGLSMRIGILF